MSIVSFMETYKIYAIWNSQDLNQGHFYFLQITSEFWRIREYHDIIESYCIEF